MLFPKREWPIRRPLPLVFFVLIASTTFTACRAGRSPEHNIAFENSQRGLVHATVYTPSATPAPGLILLHQAGASRESWAPFARMARANGYCAIAIDLRGHGASAGAANPSAFTADDWLAILGDIPAAKEQLIKAGADPNKIAIAGASIGANLAMRYAATDPQIQAIVLLSPGEEINGVSIVQTIQTYTSRPILLMAAQTDGYSARSAKKLDDLAAEYSELRLYPGAAHGTDLLDAVPVAAEQVLMWLDHILGHTPPDTH